MTTTNTTKTKTIPAKYRDIANALTAGNRIGWELAFACAKAIAPGTAAKKADYEDVVTRLTSAGVAVKADSLRRARTIGLFWGDMSQTIPGVSYNIHAEVTIGEHDDPYAILKARKVLTDLVADNNGNGAAITYDQARVAVGRKASAGSASRKASALATVAGVTGGAVDTSPIHERVIRSIKTLTAELLGSLTEGELSAVSAALAAAVKRTDTETSKRASVKARANATPKVVGTIPAAEGKALPTPKAQPKKRTPVLAGMRG